MLSFISKRVDIRDRSIVTMDHYSRNIDVRMSVPSWNISGVELLRAVTFCTEIE